MQQHRARGPAALRFAAFLLSTIVPASAWAQILLPPVKPPPAKTAPAPQPPKPPSLRMPGPTSIEAQSIEGVPDLEVTARGQVELKRDDLTIYSEFLRYNQEFGRVEADGGVRLERLGDRFFGSRLRYDTTTETGVFEEPSFLLRREQTARGSAERMEVIGRNHVRLIRGSFTTCEAGREDWKFEAAELDLDYEAGVGTLRNGRLRWLDTTILALPSASFPLERQRKSGFLAPYYSHNTRRGLEVGIPFYWNIMPEMDLTLRPTYMTKRGFQLKTDFRYLSAGYDGEVRLEHMPEDRVLGISRTGFSMRHEQQFNPNLLGVLDLNKVTDDNYFVDLSSQVRMVTLANLQRQGLLQYTGEIPRGSYYAQGRVQRFQTLQDPLAPIVPPYHRVPQLNAGFTRNEIGGWLDAHVPAEFVRFTHSTLVQGDRLAFDPVLTAPLLGPGRFLTPKIGLHQADYHLSRTNPGQSSRQNLTVPWLSVDGGLTFERETGWFGRNVTQTLEPRAFYVYVPYRNQDQLPLFDTTLADFNYAQLFNENRFVGGDRFGDTSQLTLAVTSRIVGEGGEEVFRATLGQRYYLRDERVGLTPAAPLRTRGQSDILASVGGRLQREWSVDTTLQYNPQHSQMERYGVSVRYSPEIAKVLNASYRFNRDLLHQIDISGQWPVSPGWYGVGRYNYSLRDARLLEGIAGVEYNAGCWVFRALLQRLQAATQTTSTAIFFQLELEGLGGLGSDNIVTLLSRNVPGYAVTNPRQGHLVPPGLRRPLPFEQVF
ncbi:MAG TPA: LPS-assembly protein LptD [Burkholderiales bacterium]|nr:LPS-assembly protein LptD [Burkholderiales bacterium]